MTTFREWVRVLSPAWLRRRWGSLFMHSWGFLADEVQEGVREALRNRYPSISHEDALHWIANTRNIERYSAEITQNFRSKLDKAFEFWSQAGTKQRVLAALAEAGYPGAELYEDRVDWSLPPQPFWSQFWIVFPEGSHSFEPLYWDSTLDYWPDSPNDQTTWDSNATVSELQELRIAVHKWKPKRSVCRSFIFMVEGALWDQVGQTWDYDPFYWPVSVETVELSGV